MKNFALLALFVFQMLFDFVFIDIYFYEKIVHLMFELL